MQEGTQEMQSQVTTSTISLGVLSLAAPSVPPQLVSDTRKKKKKELCLMCQTRLHHMIHHAMLCKKKKICLWRLAVSSVFRISLSRRCLLTVSREPLRTLLVRMLATSSPLVHAGKHAAALRRRAKSSTIQLIQRVKIEQSSGRLYPTPIQTASAFFRLRSASPHFYSAP